MTRLVLDAEAFNALAGPRSARRTEVRRMLTAVAEVNGEVVVPTVVLADATPSSGGDEHRHRLRAHDG